MVRGEGVEGQVWLLWGLLGEGVEEQGLKRVQVGPREEEGEGGHPLREVRERANNIRHDSLCYHQTAITTNLKGQS